MIINGSENFSVYNIQTGQQSQGPLSFLEGDKNTGWHVARNLRKPLNHLPFLQRKEAMARALNLHNIDTPREVFDFNYEMLEAHQGKKVSTTEVIRVLAEQLSSLGPQVTDKYVRLKLQEYGTIRHMEFHPTDVCNLTCTDCTYGHDEEATKPAPINFDFEAIGRIANLQPKSMVIIGGGEPTLYVDKKRRFQSMVDEVRQHIPKVALALVTNGTFLPPGDWPDAFSWIRVSLDAATSKTYTDFRGKDMFDRVVKNYLKYLEFDVPYVGISFLFAKSNVHEYARVVEFIYELVKKEKPQHLHKVNIQYRPLRRDPYEYDQSFTEAITQEQINIATKEVLALAKRNTEVAKFLREQTNITAILGGNTHPPLAFNRCYYSQSFHIIRANGDLRPCFIRVTEPDFVLGNIYHDSPETIALNTLYIAARKKPHCDAHGCRQCHVNATFEKGLSGELLPSTSPEVLADLMF